MYISNVFGCVLSSAGVTAFATVVIMAAISMVVITVNRDDDNGNHTDENTNGISNSNIGSDDDTLIGQQQLLRT